MRSAFPRQRENARKRHLPMTTQAKAGKPAKKPKKTAAKAKAKACEAPRPTRTKAVVAGPTRAKIDKRSKEIKGCGRGGAREGAGRPPGSRNKNMIELSGRCEGTRTRCARNPCETEQIRPIRSGTMHAAPSAFGPSFWPASPSARSELRERNHNQRHGVIHPRTHRRKA